MRVQSLSAIRLFVTPWTLTHQVPLSLFPGKHTGMPFLSPGELPHPGIRPTSLASPAVFTTKHSSSKVSHHALPICSKKKKKRQSFNNYFKLQDKTVFLSKKNNLLSVGSPSHSVSCSFLALPLHLLQGMEQSEGSTPSPATLWLVQKWTYDLNPPNQREPRDIYGGSARRHSFGLECVAWTCALSCCCDRFLPQGKLKRSQYKGGGQSQGTCSEMEPEPWHHKRSN